MASRPPLGIALADSLGAVPQSPKVSRGQIIAGILADALAGAAGRPGPFAAMMGQRQQREAERADWGLRRKAQMEDAIALKEWERAHPGLSPMERDAQAWAGMPDPLKSAYKQFREASGGNEFVTVTLPNGQFYPGPRSGLAAALTGGTAPRPAIGAVVPDPRANGGPAPAAPGGFPY